MRKHFKLTLTLALTISFCTVSIFAANGTRNTTTPGSWTNTAMWAGGIIPDGGSSTAYFTNEITGDVDTTIDTDTTIGNIIVNDGDGTPNKYRIENGEGVLTLKETPMPTLDCATRLDLKCVVGGLEGFVKKGAGDINIGFTSNIISGKVNLQGTGTVILNNKDALMNADVIVETLVNSRKYECNTKTITVNSNGIFNVLNTTIISACR